MHVAVVPTTEAKAKEEAKVAVQLEVMVPFHSISDACDF